MFLLLLEDGTPLITDTITNGDRQAADAGILDIFDLRNATAVFRYWDKTWEELPIVDNFEEPPL